MPEKVLNVLEITFYLFIFFAWGVRRGNASVCHRAVFILFQPVCLSSMPPPSQYRTAHSCCTSAPLTGIFLWDFVNAAHDMSSCVIMCHHMTCHRVSSCVVTCQKTRFFVYEASCPCGLCLFKCPHL